MKYQCTRCKDTGYVPIKDFVFVCEDWGDCPNIPGIAGSIPGTCLTCGVQECKDCNNGKESSVGG